MIRKIIKIDRDKCNGCELCVKACHESAIGMVDGKAALLRDDYCDGLGDCLPSCPTGAISFEEREALDYNQEEVEKNMMKKAAQENNKAAGGAFQGGCPGSRAQAFNRGEASGQASGEEANRQNTVKSGAAENYDMPSQLNQWPVQIKLVPINAPYFENANLLVSADCAAYAYAGFHKDFMHNHITLIGCPKLDEGDYSEKLTDILKNNNIKSVTVVRMEVPCCGGLENAVKNALMNCGKLIQWKVVTMSVDGRVLEN